MNAIDVLNAVVNVVGWMGIEMNSLLHSHSTTYRHDQTSLYVMAIEYISTNDSQSERRDIKRDKKIGCV